MDIISHTAYMEANIAIFNMLEKIFHCEYKFAFRISYWDPKKSVSIIEYDFRAEKFNSYSNIVLWAIL